MAEANLVTLVVAVWVLLTLSVLLLVDGNNIAKSTHYAAPNEIVRPDNKLEIFNARRLSPPSFPNSPIKFHDTPNMEGNRRNMLAGRSKSPYAHTPPTATYPPPPTPVAYAIP